jgi:hypothetical protein
MDNEGCGKIAAIITVIAGLIAIFVFVTGKQNLPQVVQEDRSAPVQVSFTPTPTIVPSRVPPATVRQPTTAPTPVPPPTPVPTPVPPPTPVPDTAPGTILQVGQTWSSGLELTLASTKLDTGNSYFDVGIGSHASFLLRNRRNQDLSIRYSTNNISAQDNFGNRLNVLGCMDGCTTGNSGFEIVRIIHSGESMDLSIFSGGFYVEVDTANPSITEIIISVSGISSINNARWRIPVYH